MGVVREDFQGFRLSTEEMLTPFNRTGRTRREAGAQEAKKQF